MIVRVLMHDSAVRRCRFFSAGHAAGILTEDYFRFRSLPAEQAQMDNVLRGHVLEFEPSTPVSQLKSQTGASLACSNFSRRI
jgi:hypothetical protein